jgi:hypothetical protein
VGEEVDCCVSNAIPRGMVVFTNRGRVVGVRVPGGPDVTPLHFDLVQFSGEDFPAGSADLLRMIADIKQQRRRLN